MKKKTKLALLLLGIVLLLAGIVLLSISFWETKTPTFWDKTPNASFSSIKIDLSECTLTLLPAAYTHIEVRGYQENALLFSVVDHELVLSDDLTLLDRLGLGREGLSFMGIGHYLKNAFRMKEEKAVILYLSEEDRQKTTEIELKNGAVTLSSPLSRLSLYADQTAVYATNFTFHAFSLQLYDCTTVLSFDMNENEFSRRVETYRTAFTQNGNRDANSDYYTVGGNAPSLSLVAYGGSCTINTEKTE